MSKVIMYGADWCGDCIRSKRLLDEHKIEYEYFDIVARPDLVDKVIGYNEQAGVGSIRRIPIILVGDKILSEPSNTELAEALGVSA